MRKQLVKAFEEIVNEQLHSLVTFGVLLEPHILRCVDTKLPQVSLAHFRPFNPENLSNTAGIKRDFPIQTDETVRRGSEQVSYPHILRLSSLRNFHKSRSELSLATEESKSMKLNNNFDAIGRVKSQLGFPQPLNTNVNAEVQTLDRFTPSSSPLDGMPDLSKYPDWKPGSSSAPKEQILGGLDSLCFVDGKVMTRREAKRRYG